MSPTPFPDRDFAAFLFDMDGTILSSIAAAERVWARWALRHGLDVAAFLPTIHGRRSVETVRSLNLPGVDAQAESDAITAQEMLDVEGVEPITGAAAFLGSLPQGRWGIVTSGHRALAERRMRAVGLPIPSVMVCGDEIVRGKPDPEGFLAGARAIRRFPAGRCAASA